MTWEIAAVVTVFAVPFSTIYMANRQLDPEVHEAFWWIRLLIFIFNLALISLGLWTAQVIAKSQNVTVGNLMQTAWQAYTGLMTIVIIIIVVVLGIQLFHRMFDKFPSLKERR